MSLLPIAEHISQNQSYDDDVCVYKMLSYLKLENWTDLLRLQKCCCSNYILPMQAILSELWHTH